MRRALPRLLFLAVLAGALLWWSQSRRPRDLRVEVDLTAVEPGGVTAVEVIVRRGGHALARHEVHYGPGGAPATLALTVQASPGDAEVETTLVRAGKPSQRVVAKVRLSSDAVARVSVR